MTNHDPSSFLQAVESRLDSIFGEDAKPPQPKDSGISPTAGEDTVSVTVDMREVHGEATSYTAEPEAREALSLAEDAVAGTKENILAGPVDEEADQASAHAAQVRDRSAYLSEIDKRFAAIFGDEDKKPAPPPIRPSRTIFRAGWPAPTGWKTKTLINFWRAFP